MSTYRPGAEKVPQRGINFNDARPIMVMIYDLSVSDDQDALVIEERLDYSKFDDRKRLGQLTFWAITNHHSVETIALEDAAPPLEQNV